MKIPTFYLSFAAPDRFLGGLIVCAASLEDAVVIATAAGLNPGGEVLGVPAPLELALYERWGGRLLTAEEVHRFDVEANANPRPYQ